ncbi:glucose-6-phosphate dehydrogenase [Celerinatantimonas sp. MCCC 1A17872]|uniref:glucose-6-phosphate dehydrogenase n=1 Tax=Celerinatantimonas sp. MCCC 1A17872 TaxID=3177514 RepID=UPI0038C8E0A7
MNQLDNNCIAIFGASGDLTRRKLIPALYHLYITEQLSASFSILGISRTEYSDDAYRARIKDALIESEKLEDSEQLNEFCSHIHYQSLNTADQENYAVLKGRLTELSQQYDTAGNVIYYLSTPPSLYGVIPECLAAHDLNSEKDGWKRLIVEKPFGYDKKSAVALDKQLHRFFREEQIYRIDHYLGKETVQNLLVFRFSNGLFEPLWNRNYIDHVEITSAEALGVEGRGGYYDGAGAMRDMFQNHLLQVLGMVAMEPPARINSDAIRNETFKVFQSLHPLDETSLNEDLVLGQYTSSDVRGEHLVGYREEQGVDENSRTETYVALKLSIDNWRWNGVPFYVRTGKRLPTRVTEVVIHFKKTPHPVFGQNTPDNKLVIRIQPDEGILMKFGLKKPGAGFESQEVSMDFRYDSLDGAEVLTAYERLLLDSIKGDPTLFARSDAVLACWDFVQPILDITQNNPTLYGYACGTWGPKEADELLTRDGRQWRFPCKNLTDTDYCEL